MNKRVYQEVIREGCDIIDALVKGPDSMSAAAYARVVRQARMWSNSNRYIGTFADDIFYHQAHSEGGGICEFRR